MVHLSLPRLIGKHNIFEVILQILHSALNVRIAFIFPQYSLLGHK